MQVNAGASKGQRCQSPPDILALELQALVRWSKWVLGTKLGASARVVFLTTGLSLQPLSADHKLWIEWKALFTVCSVCLFHRLDVVFHMGICQSTTGYVNIIFLVGVPLLPSQVSSFMSQYLYHNTIHCLIMVRNPPSCIRL